MGRGQDRKMDNEHFPTVINPTSSWHFLLPLYRTGSAFKTGLSTFPAPQKYLWNVFYYRVFYFYQIIWRNRLLMERVKYIQHLQGAGLN